MKKRKGEKGRGSKLLPRLEMVSVTFRRPLTNLPKKKASVAQRRGEGDNICYYFSLPFPPPPSHFDAKRLETDG